MYIEDQEFREIYQTVTPERLQVLETSLLHLEKNPKDVDSLEEFLREAHTLKGDSRMLGVTDVETLIHQMEDTMINVKQGKTYLTTNMCDRFHNGLDAVRLLVNEAITGESSGVNTFMVLADLIGSEDEQVSEISFQQESDSLFELDHGVDVNDVELFNDIDDVETADFSSDNSGNPSQLFSIDESSSEELAEFIETMNSTPAISKPDPVKSVDNAPQRRADDTGTIRVKTEDLDKLVRQSSELSIAQLNTNRRLESINEIIEIWEELHNSFAHNRELIKQIDVKTQSKEFSRLNKYQKDSEQQLEKLGDLISQLKGNLYEDNTNLSTIAKEMDDGVKSLRLMPFSTIFTPLQRLVRELSREQNKQIDLVIEGSEIKVDKQIIDQMKDPLLHLVRNAVDHGIETVEERQLKGKPATATIVLKGYQVGSTIMIELQDDGQGLNLEKIRKTALRKNIATEEQLTKMSVEEVQDLIFASGFSTRSEVSEISGRGVGLDVVRNNVNKLKGNITVESSIDRGCTFHLQIKTTLGSTEALLVKVNESTFALPVDLVKTIKLVSAKDIYTLNGSRVIKIDDQPTSVVWLADSLNLPVAIPNSTEELDRASKSISCIILRSGKNHLGVLVDEVIDQEDIVLKPQSALLKRVRNIAGATILGNGEVCSVLNTQDLIDLVRGGKLSSTPKSKSISALEKAKTETLTTNKIVHKVLLVEDSIIIRKQMERILAQGGYEVTSAVNGEDGLKKLPTDKFDAIISDVEMPKMNGLELTSKVRQQPEFRHLPIVLVTTLAKREDKIRGMEAGANAYLTKGDFDQQLLINTLEELM